MKSKMKQDHCKMKQDENKIENVFITDNYYIEKYFVHCKL